ncbi:MAG TPA: SCO family protein [Chthoniobacterales bacterium]|nr:SCO family protein [Chthoniobacterales bacterium]
MIGRILFYLFVFERFCLWDGLAQATDPAKDPNRDIRFEPRLNRVINLDERLTDENGNTIRLDQYFHQRPVILALGYYQCPMLCGVVLNALVQGLQDLPPTLAQRDFNFIFVSIDPNENSGLAKNKLENYLRRYGWGPAVERWHFLTGAEPAVKQVADEIGFRYRYDQGSKQYVHPSGLVVLTPNGKISSYLLGIEFPAKDIDHSISLARNDAVSAPVSGFALLCFCPNVAPGSVAYVVLVILRITAVLTMMVLGIFIYRANRRRSRNLMT